MRSVRHAVFVVCLLAGGLVAATRCATPDPGCVVPDPAICGSDTCVDLRADPENCGSCGRSCNGGECIGSFCRCGGVTCASRTAICCDGVCADLQSDRLHCGSCGNECPEGIGCTLGVCTGEACPGGCAAGWRCCGLGCADVNNDENNCGGCGVVCDPGQVCESGACIVSACSPPCVDPERCCGETCTNTDTDPNNCGYCGNRCLDDDPPLANSCVSSGGRAHCSCNGSADKCRPGQLCCPDGCRSVTADPNNCGACGNVCGPGETCRDSVCSCGDLGASCAAGESCCTGACLDTSADMENCGGCGTRCDPERTDACVDGACKCGTGAPCAAPVMMCGLTPDQHCCSGACQEFGTAEVCNACDTPCPDGQTCDFGFWPYPPCTWVCS